MVEEVTTRHYDKIIKILSIVFGIILLIILIVLGVAEVISIFWIVLIGSIILLLLTAIYLFFYFLSKRKKEKTEEKIETKLAPVSLKQARDICKEAIEDPEYCDYGTPLGEEVRMLGESETEKSPIYIRKAKGEYSNDVIVTILNMSDVEKRTVLINPSDMLIDRAANLLARLPREQAETTIIEEFPTGVTKTTKQKNITKVEKAKQEQKKKEEEKAL